MKKPGFSRFMFMEACFRLAKLIYASNAEYDHYGNGDDDMNAKYAMKMHSAFEIFVKNILKPFKKSCKVHWQKFRDNKLSDYEVELLFTMNLPSIN